MMLTNKEIEYFKSIKKLFVGYELITINDNLDLLYGKFSNHVLENLEDFNLQYRMQESKDKFDNPNFTLFKRCNIEDETWDIFNSVHFNIRSNEISIFLNCANLKVNQGLGEYDWFWAKKFSFPLDHFLNNFEDYNRLIQFL